MLFKPLPNPSDLDSLPEEELLSDCSTLYTPKDHTQGILMQSISAPSQELQMESYPARPSFLQLSSLRNTDNIKRAIKYQEDLKIAT